MAGMADLPVVNSDSNGRSSPGSVGLVTPNVGFVGAGLGAVVPGDFVAAGAGFDPGLAFIDAPQNGQSTASSSMTD